MTWVSIDGVEGVGKSTLASCIAARLRGLLLVPEFSDGLAGTLLKSAVARSPHHVSASPVGQSLLFLAEWRETVDTIVTPARDTMLVLTDRGMLSKYVYQYLVLEPVIGTLDADRLLLAAFSGIEPPDLTICLTASEDVLSNRLAGRKEERTDAQWHFIRRAREMFLSTNIFGRTVVFDTSVLSPVCQCEELISLIQASGSVP